MKLSHLDQNELYPTEKLGPHVEGVLLYKVGDQTHFNGAYITTNERLIMNVDMNGESYKRAFSYNDIDDISLENEGVMITFSQGMGRIAMIDISDGDKEAFVDYVTTLINK